MVNANNDHFKVVQHEVESYKMKYKICKWSNFEANTGFEYRGAQILIPMMDKAHLLEHDYYNKFSAKYEGSIIEDWKNNKILEGHSIIPENFSSYFEKDSQLPYELSPLYFKPEVLDKYKNNPDKYQLLERRITCKGAWVLESYDVNDSKQVHTYAVYLSRLPYSEQQHWKLYNEKPRGRISKRAYKTDFEGAFPDLSLIEHLKQLMSELHSLKIGGVDEPLWKPKSEKGLFFVITENSKQWVDAITALSAYVIDDFNEKALRLTLKRFDLLKGDEKGLGSLGLIRCALSHSGNNDLIETIHGALKELRNYRSQGSVHGDWKIPQGSLIEKYGDILKRTIYAIEKMTQIFHEIFYNTTM